MHYLITFVMYALKVHCAQDICFNQCIVHWIVNVHFAKCIDGLPCQFPYRPRHPNLPHKRHLYPSHFFTNIFAQSYLISIL